MGWRNHRAFPHPAPTEQLENHQGFSTQTMRVAHKPATILELRVFDAWRFRQEQTAHRMTGRGPGGPLFFVRFLHNLETEPVYRMGSDDLFFSRN
ncbi:hypothetical protein AGR9A_Lc20225 [Agrobacterium salinitolerans str. Hayward 0363]|nr:hypothetical protein AGR9A_Lc20225 [Agrobacterium salinitolerans str. Hayward 0363]